MLRKIKFIFLFIFAICRELTVEMKTHDYTFQEGFGAQ